MAGADRRRGVRHSFKRTVDPEFDASEQLVRIVRVAEEHLLGDSHVEGLRTIRRLADEGLSAGGHS